MYTRGVSTRNYQAVHVYGKATIMNNQIALQRMLNKLTAKYGSASDNPWQPVYRTSILRAIVGINIEIGEIQGNYKLSQNRSSHDRQRFIEIQELNLLLI